MNQRNARLFRKVFKDRTQYRAYKKTYTSTDLPTRLKTLEVVNQIIDSGKEIKVL